MLQSFSSKAIASKARAMYGRRLTGGDYAEMIKKSSVGEVAVYLRDNTHYGQALAELRTEDARRGQLEDRLRSLRYDQYAALTRYCFSREAGFYQYIYLWDEIEQVIKLLRYIGGGSEGEHFPRYSRQLARYCSYDLELLSVCRDYSALLEGMRGTAYYEILRRYPPNEDRAKNQIDVVLCECELRSYYYHRVFEMIDKEFGGKAASELRELFLQEIDAENIADAYRLRRFFNSDPSYIRRALLPFETPSRKLVEQIVTCEDDKELGELLASSRFARGNVVDSDYIESLTSRERERTSRHALRYSTCPAATLVSYMSQTQIELENVINVIEAIRYGLDAVDIKKLLILEA